MANNIGTAHLADYPKLYEPQRTNNFEFIVTDIDDLLQPGVSEELATESDHILNGQDVIRVSVVSTTVPSFELSVIDVKRGNATIHFAGTPTFSTGSLTLNDYIGARTRDALLAWQALAYDVVSEKVQMVSKYKKNCQLIEYTPDYSEIVRTWDLKGCWISNVTVPDLSNETNDKVTITATVVYDKAIPHKPE